MMVTQVDLIRRRSYQLLKNLHIYISCLPHREESALAALTGAEGQKTFTRIADFILAELGHTEPKQPETERKGYRTTQNYTNTLTLDRKKKDDIASQQI